MGSEIDIPRSSWIRYLDDQAKEINVFDFINASIAVAAVTKPKEFLSRRSEIIESLFKTDSQAKNPSLINHQEQVVIIHGCEEDHVCKDDHDGESDKEFADILERNLELDEYDELIEFDNVMMASLKPIKVRPQLQVSTVHECGVQYDELVRFDQVMMASLKPIKVRDNVCGNLLSFDATMKAPLKHINVRPRLEEKPQKVQIGQQVSKGYTETKFEVGEDKVRKFEVSSGCRSGTKFEQGKKRKIKEINEKSTVDPYELKFEATKRRFEERNQQIEKAKRRVQILDVKETRLGRDGRPKEGFGSRMKKIQKPRF